MNIERLRVFLAVYESSSMTAAAARLGITQPAVSQSVRELEEEVGAELFVRGRKGISPTHQADRFWEVARRAVRAFDAAEQEGQRLRQPARSALRIGTTCAPSLAFMPEAIARFADTQTDLLPTLRVLEGETLAASLRVDTFDVAVVDFDTSKLDRRHFECVELFQDPLVAGEAEGAVPTLLRGDTVTSAELLRMPLILPPTGSMARQRLQDAFDELGIDSAGLIPRVEIGSVVSTLVAIADGLGIGLLSHLAAERAVRRGAVHVARIKDLALPTPVVAVRPRDGSASEVGEAFWSYLRSLSYLSPVQRANVGLAEDAPPSTRAS